MTIEDQLRHDLESAVAATTPSSSLWDRIERRTARSHDLRRRALALAVAVVVATLGVGYGIRAIQSPGRTIAPPSPALRPIGSVRLIELGWNERESASSVAAVGGYVWTAGNQSSAMVGPDGSVHALPFRQAPFSLSATSSATWASGFEPGTGDYVARFPIGRAAPDLFVPLPDVQLSRVVASDAAIWVLGGPTVEDPLGKLLRLDPRTGEIESQGRLSEILPKTLGTNPIVYDAGADDDALWVLVADIEGETLGKISLERIDDVTGDVQTFDAGRIAYFALGDGDAWLPGPDGPLRLDPATGEISEIPALRRQELIPFDASDGSVWFIGGSPTEVRIARLDLDGTPAVAYEQAVDRGRYWGSVQAAYDDQGTVWLLYETGQLQAVSVG